MTDSTNGISYSLDLSGSAPAARVEKSFGPADLMVVSLPQGRMLLRDRRSASHSVVDEKIGSLLLGMPSLQPLSTYVDALIRSQPSLAGARTRIRSALEKLVKDGILLSEDHFLEQWRAQPGEALRSSIEYVFVRTCGRPALLQRLLSSLQPHAASVGCECVVLDDSPDEAEQKANAELVARLAGEWVSPILYHGRQAQAALCDELKTEFSEHTDSIDWLLAPVRQDSQYFSAGRMLNHALLLSAGACLLLVDDDAVLEPRRTNAQTPALVIGDQERKAHFFARIENSLEAAPPLAVNPLDEHGSWLGSSLARMMQSGEGADGLSLRGVPLSAAHRWSADSSAALTANGVVGDPGTGSSDWIYRLQGESLKNLLDDARKFEQVRLARAMALEYEGMRLNPDLGSLMFTTTLGIDNRDLMPPTSPVFRNEDLLFGALVQFVRPSDFMIGLPWALPHLPDPPRQWSEQSLDRAAANGILGTLKDLVYNALPQCHAEARTARLRYLAMVLRDLARASDQALSQGLRENQLRLQSRIAAALTTQLAQQPNAPEAWRSDIQRMLKASSEAMMDSASPQFPELPASPSAEDGLSVFRGQLRRFGEALAIWPDLWTKAREMRSR